MKSRFIRRYCFMLKKSIGVQLEQIAKPLDDGVIRPVIDPVYPFEKTNKAVAYAESCWAHS